MKENPPRAQNHMQRKFTLRILFMVTLPVLLVILLLLVKNEQDLNEDLQRANQQVATQMLSSLQTYCEQIDRVALLMQSDSVLSTFLGRHYKAGVDYTTYARSIRPHLNYIINSGDDKSTFLFQSNPSIPEGFGFFYSDDYLWEDPLFADFLRDKDADMRWLFLPARTRYTPYHPLSRTQDAMLYIRKLKPLDQMAVAYVVTIVPIPTLLAASGYGKDCVFSEEINTLYVNFAKRALSEDTLWRLAQGEQIATRAGHAFYSIHDLSPLPLRLLTVTSRVGNISSYLIACVALLAMMPLINYIFVYYWTRLVQSIQRLIREARRALVGDLSFRLHPTNEKDLNVIVDSINYLLERVSGLLQEVIRQENATRDAQLLALQHQINPHFIYNTMELLAGRMEVQGMYEESDALTDFAHLFRYNLNAANEATTLASEVANVERYLGIQRLLRGGVVLTQEIEPELRMLPVMRFLLQPLVENSLEHGGHGQDGTLLLTLRAKREGKFARILVADNGMGMMPEQLEQVRAHLQSAEEGHVKESIGLYNIHSRLQLLYGTTLWVESVPNVGTTVSFLVPLLQPPAGRDDLAQSAATARMRA